MNLRFLPPLHMALSAHGTRDIRPSRQKPRMQNSPPWSSLHGVLIFFFPLPPTRHDCLKETLRRNLQLLHSVKIKLGEVRVRTHGRVCERLLKAEEIRTWGRQASLTYYALFFSLPFISLATQTRYGPCSSARCGSSSTQDSIDSG